MQRKRGTEASQRSLADKKKRNNVFARGLRDLVVTNRRRLALKRQQKAAAAGVGADGDAAAAEEAAAFGGTAQRPAASVTPLSLPHASAGAAWRPTPSADGVCAASLDMDALPPQLRLQLFPVDDATHAAVSTAGLNPHLELTFKCATRVTCATRLRSHC